jgi:hypothetical protein
MSGSGTKIAQKVPILGERDNAVGGILIFVQRKERQDD